MLWFHFCNFQSVAVMMDKLEFLIFIALCTVQAKEVGCGQCQSDGPIVRICRITTGQGKNAARKFRECCFDLLAWASTSGFTATIKVPRQRYRFPDVRWSTAPNAFDASSIFTRKFFEWRRAQCFTRHYLSAFMIISVYVCDVGKERKPV